MCQTEKFPEFKKRLNKLLVESGQTIVAFADFLGTSRQSLGYYLNGQRLPDAIMIRQICDRCNVSADWLLGISEVKHINPDLKTASKCTKLSEEAILALAKINTFPLEYILTNEILRNLFGTMLDDIHEAHLEIKVKKEVHELDDPRYRFTASSLLQDAEYHILHAGRCAERIAEFASNYPHFIPLIKAYDEGAE